MTKVFSDSALQLVLGQARASLDEVSETLLSKFGSNQISGGRLWTNSIYFDTEAADAKGRVYVIPPPYLLRSVSLLLNLNEPILKVQRYQTEVYGFSHVPQALLNHQFIVFETKGPWWWSVEKNMEGITLQRSQDRDAVLCKYRQEPRAEVFLLEQKDATCDLKDFIHWLHNTKQLTKVYNAFLSNCQHFVIDVYKQLSRSPQERSLVQEFAKRYSCDVENYLVF